MKYYLTCIILFTTILIVNAQKTVTLNKQWNIIDHKVFSPNFCTGLYSFKNDTIINSKEYLQLSVTGDTINNSSWYPQNTFLREDSLNRIYILENEIETILYDFNLIEGDTFLINNEFVNCELIVSSVDSIELLTGELRKRIRLISSNDPDPNQPLYGYKDWIQGIGSSTSLVRYYYSCYTDYPYDLLCYFEDGVLVYSKPNNLGCFLTPTQEINQNDDEIVLFPNPSIQTIEIKADQKIKGIKIFNFNGQFLMKSSENFINIELLDSGIYLAQIETQNGITIKRFVVE